jgi:hypothetical protein
MITLSSRNGFYMAVHYSSTMNLLTSISGQLSVPVLATSFTNPTISICQFQPAWHTYFKISLWQKTTSFQAPNGWSDTINISLIDLSNSFIQTTNTSASNRATTGR